MKDLFTLTFYDNLNDYWEGFFIGVFASYAAAESTARKYLNSVSGFKDYPCRYEIKTKKVIGEADKPETVSMVWGWNINDQMDEVDIWESDLYTNKNAAEQALITAKEELRRQEWCIDTYIIGECLCQDGFVRV